MGFKYALNQSVKVAISGEKGQVKGRAEYAGMTNQYYIHYLTSDGRAVNNWFDEDELSASQLQD